MAILKSPMDKYEKQKKAALSALTYVQSGFTTITDEIAIKRSSWSDVRYSECFVDVGVGGHVSHKVRLFKMNHSHRLYDGEVSTIQVDLYSSGHLECNYSIVKQSDVIMITIGKEESQLWNLELSEEELFQYSTIMDPKVFEYYNIAKAIHGKLEHSDLFCTTGTSLDYLAMSL